MPIQEEEFLKRLRATFNVEAEEHLETISTGLLELEKSPAPPRQQAVIEAVYREAHSLKGAARAVNLSDIEALCQALEGALAAWKQQRISASTETFDTLHKTIDAIRNVLAAPAAEQGTIDQRRRAELVQSLNRLQSRPHFTGHQEPDRAETGQSDPPATYRAPPPGPPVAAEKTAVPETVRVSTAVLDARLLQAEEMLTVKLSAAQRAADLRDVTELFEPWRKAWAKAFARARAARLARTPAESAVEDSQPDTAAALTEFLDWNSGYMSAMENKLRSLATQAEQDRQNVGRMVDNLLEDSKRLLMLPFATLAAPLPKLVRDLSRDQGKEVELRVSGGDIELDKRVLEEMKDAFTHILRNCIDHGVETPDRRERLNKPRRASIHIAASRVNGQRIEILVSDDGAGVDLERLKASAVRHGIVTEAQARALTEEETLALMYQSEVSTSQIITEISGRGLGMAIVRAKVEKLGGKISLESKGGVGTTLRLVLPLAIAQFRGILVEVAGHVFVVPTMNVERVLRVSPRDIQSVENRETIALQGLAVSLARLEAVLELPPKTTKLHGDSDRIPVMVLCAAEQRIAFTVDAVLHEEEVLVKPFKKPLVRVRNIAAATVLASGAAVPILNVMDLMKSARRSSAALAPAPEYKEVQADQIRILVAEDSITSRMLLKNILESVGYQVKTAVDGIDAFTALRQERFELVVSDVEMPRLNGFDLTARIRADKRLADLPVVLVTALESHEEREHGIDVGANAYIVKSNFEQSNLLETVRRLV